MKVWVNGVEIFKGIDDLVKKEIGYLWLKLCKNILVNSLTSKILLNSYNGRQESKRKPFGFDEEDGLKLFKILCDFLRIASFGKS
ncbi:hypothetical protein HPU229254_00520 [Helicobacter pullorum]|nr:hypothetical protein HPU229254_00520 [Helicobacter pullorum]